MKKLRLNCPSCGNPLYSDELAKHLAWCRKEDCPLFIKRLPPFDIVIMRDEGSFLDMVDEEAEE